MLRLFLQLAFLVLARFTNFLLAPVTKHILVKYYTKCTVTDSARSVVPDTERIKKLLVNNKKPLSADLGERKQISNRSAGRIMQKSFSPDNAVCY